MSTAENIALDRRVDALETQLLAAEPVRIRTRFTVCERGYEEPCRTVEDVYQFVDRPAAIKVVRVVEDLDVLIEPATGCHLRSTDCDEFEELAQGVRIIDVPIMCHAVQLEQILSCKG